MPCVYWEQSGNQEHDLRTVAFASHVWKWVWLLPHIQQVFACLTLAEPFARVSLAALPGLLSILVFPSDR